MWIEVNYLYCPSSLKKSPSNFKCNHLPAFTEYMSIFIKTRPSNLITKYLSIFTKTRPSNLITVPTDYSRDFSSRSYVPAFNFFPRCSLSHGNGGLAILCTSMKCGRDFYIRPAKAQANKEKGPSGLFTGMKMVF